MIPTSKERRAQELEYERKYGKDLIPLSDRLLGEPERTTVNVGDTVTVNVGMYSSTGVVVEVVESGAGAWIRRNFRGRDVTMWVWARNIRATE